MKLLLFQKMPNFTSRLLSMGIEVRLAFGKFNQKLLTNFYRAISDKKKSTLGAILKFLAKNLAKEINQNNQQHFFSLKSKINSISILLTIIT